MYSTASITIASTLDTTVFGTLAGITCELAYTLFLYLTAKSFTLNDVGVGVGVNDAPGVCVGVPVGVGVMVPVKVGLLVAV